MQNRNAIQWYDESVNGIVIGQITFPYEFWIYEPRQEYQHKANVPTRRVDKSFFENDEQAIAWFKENYPIEFRHGVEMRVFEQ